MGAKQGTAPVNCVPSLKNRIGHVCLQCGGEFRILATKSDPGDSDSIFIDIDFAYLVPDPSWGTFKQTGALLKSVLTLEGM